VGQWLDQVGHGEWGVLAFFPISQKKYRKLQKIKKKLNFQKIAENYKKLKFPKK
jgi:hypothetical protein